MKKTTKFSKGLVNDIKEEMHYNEEQTILKNKYNIQEDVVVVEKDHIWVDIFKTTLAVIVYILACIGVVALLFPEPRKELFLVFNDMVGQLMALLPVK